jgi:hypothetical protein
LQFPTFQDLSTVTRQKIPYNFNLVAFCEWQETGVLRRMMEVAIPQPQPPKPNVLMGSKTSGTTCAAMELKREQEA